MPFAWTGRAGGRGRLERKAGRLTFSTSIASGNPGHQRGVHGGRSGPVRFRSRAGRPARGRHPEAGHVRRKPQPVVPSGSGGRPGRARLSRSGDGGDQDPLAGQVARVGDFQHRGPQARGRSRIPRRVPRAAGGPFRVPRRRQGRRRLRGPRRHRRGPRTRIRFRPPRGDGPDRPGRGHRRPDPGQIADVRTT
jgi:hypothetical protein